MRDTKLVAAKLVQLLDRDKRSVKQFAESIPDQQRRRKLIAELKQVLEGKR